MIVKSVLALRLSPRFWKKVKATKHPRKCWEWISSKNKAGYGQLSVGGRKGRPMLAHRVSWIIHNGKIPTGLNVLHSCDNPGCVRPGHLRVGSHQENTDDAVSRGRMARGKKLPHTKLTVKQVIEIRRSHTKLIRNLSRLYRISVSMVSAILRRDRRALVK